MASLTADPNRIKPSICSNPCPKVRIVAKIRGFKDHESESLSGDSAPWISVRKPNDDASRERVKIHFGDQATRDTYEVDYFYEQNEDNDVIFLREIKPLIPGVFDGQHIAIIAYGARGSGKTHTIMGTEGKQGLAALAIEEILSMGEDMESSISVSCYEVVQDRVYDLLDPSRKEVQILEDTKGKIMLKGLSQGFVNSVHGFQTLYLNGCVSNQAMQKIPFELPRSHKGLIIRILSNNESSNAKLLGKITFVDLAGYEDARRRSFEGLASVESAKVNKSLHALLDVVYALNTNETHVPFRQSKLTRMLKDSFGGTNQSLMITCLNPLFCQDTINATSLASRSCQGVNRDFTKSTKKTKCSDKPVGLSALSKGKIGSVSSTVKKPSSSRAYFSEKKTSCLVKGRKLFDEGNNFSCSKQDLQIPSAEEKPTSEALSAAMIKNEIHYLQEEVITDVLSATIPKSEETSPLNAPKDAKPLGEKIHFADGESISAALSAAVPPTNEETSPLNVPKDAKPIVKKDISLYIENNHSEVAADMDSNIKALTCMEDDENVEKENNYLLTNNEGGSPPLSARLRELSNNLKSLCSSTPARIKLPHQTDTPSGGQVVSVDSVEPKTPVIEQDLRVQDKWQIAQNTSPAENFNARSSGVKNSLVQEYLKFLNSASKEELKGIQGIGEKRATYILELREESPEPFKDLDDLRDIGLSGKQIKGMMKKVAGELFS